MSRIIQVYDEEKQINTQVSRFNQSTDVLSPLNWGSKKCFCPFILKNLWEAYLGSCTVSDCSDCTEEGFDLVFMKGDKNSVMVYRVSGGPEKYFHVLYG